MTNTDSVPRDYLIIPADTGIYPTLEEAKTAAVTSTNGNYVIVSHPRATPGPAQQQHTSVIRSNAPPPAVESTKEDKRLFKAVIDADWHTVDACLLAGGNPNLITDVDYARSLLHYAVDNGDMQTVRLLLAAGAIIDSVELFTGTTPLFVALWNQPRPDMVCLLLAAGASVDITDFDKNTALINLIRVVCTNRTTNRMFTEVRICAVIDCATILIAAGAYINAVNADGMSALHYAVSSPPKKLLCRYLLDAGADPMLATSQGTAYDNASDDTLRELLNWYIKPTPSATHQRIKTRIPILMSSIQRGIDDGKIQPGWRITEIEVEVTALNAAAVIHKVAITRASQNDISLPLMQALALPQIATAEVIRITRVTIVDYITSTISIYSDWC